MEQELKLLEWIGIGTDISCSGQLCLSESRDEELPVNLTKIHKH